MDPEKVSIELTTIVMAIGLMKLGREDRSQRVSLRKLEGVDTFCQLAYVHAFRTGHVACHCSIAMPGHGVNSFGAICQRYGMSGGLEK